MESTASFPGKWKIAQRPPAEPASISGVQEIQPVKILLGASKRTDNHVQVQPLASPLTSTQVHAQIQPNPIKVQQKPKKPDEAVFSLSASKKIMGDAVRLLDDNLEFLDFCKEYLLDSNKKFTVIGAVGAQGVGKSTTLSMLAGNEPTDFYREYVFRPSSREGVESNRFQTTKIFVYINKFRTIFLDCQAVGCASLFEEHIYRRQAVPADAFELVSLQLLTLLSNVCHTLLLCIDWFIDLATIRELMKVEVHSPLAEKEAVRRVNLVVLHQRAKAVDFQPIMVRQRMDILEGIFENSIFDVCGGLTMASCGFRRYDELKSNVNYLLLGEIKPRAKVVEGQANQTEFKQFSRVNAPPNAAVIPGVIEYSDVLQVLRIELLRLPKPNFLLSNDFITEAEWFNLAAKTWKRVSSQGRDSSFYRTEATPSSTRMPMQTQRRRKENTSPRRQFQAGTPRSIQQKRPERSKFLGETTTGMDRRRNRVQLRSSPTDTSARKQNKEDEIVVGNEIPELQGLSLTDNSD